MVFLKKECFNLFILVGLMLLAACTSVKEPRVLLEEALEKSVSYNSYNMTGGMKTKFILDGEEYAMDMTMNGVFFADPQKAKMEMTLKNYEEEEPVSSLIYLEEVDGVYTMYAGSGNEWYSEEVDSSAAESLTMDQSESVRLFMENSLGISVVGEDEIGGKKADVVRVTADPAIFSQIGQELPQNTLLKMEDFADMGNLIYDVSITEDGIAKLYMNLSENFKALGEAMLNDPEATDEMKEIAEFYKSSEVVTEFIFTNINSAEEFSIPEEAKK